MVSRELLDTCYIIKCISGDFLWALHEILRFFFFLVFFSFRLVSFADSVEKGGHVSAAFPVYKLQTSTKPENSLHAMQMDIKLIQMTLE